MVELLGEVVDDGVAGVEFFLEFVEFEIAAFEDAVLKADV